MHLLGDFLEGNKSSGMGGGGVLVLVKLLWFMGADYGIKLIYEGAISYRGLSLWEGLVYRGSPVH